MGIGPTAEQAEPAHIAIHEDGALDALSPQTSGRVVVRTRARGHLCCGGRAAECSKGKRIGLPVAPETDAFQQLNHAELAALGQLGVRRAVSAGEYLYREGDPGYDFYVVLAGAVEFVVSSEGKDRVIARHPAGRFLGELNLLTGQRVFVSARVAEPGEVLAIPRDALRRLIATDASLSDKILAAFLARRAILMSGASSAIRVISSRFSPDSGRVREFLVRNRIPHEWLDPDADSDVERLLRELDIAARDLPVVIVSSKVLRHPTSGELAEYLGLTVGTMITL